MARTVLLAGTLDTKGAEYAFVRDRLRALGCDVLVMDLGIQGEPVVSHRTFQPPRSREPAAGLLDDLRARADRGAAVDVMQRGACALMPALFAEHRFDGVLGLGGGGGTTMITAAMRSCRSACRS